MAKAIEYVYVAVGIGVAVAMIISVVPDGQMRKISSIASTTAVELCEPLGKPGDSCLGDLAVGLDGRVYRTSLDHGAFDRTPVEMSQMLKNQEAFKNVPVSAPDYVRLSAQYTSQLPPE